MISRRKIVFGSLSAVIASGTVAQKAAAQSGIPQFTVPNAFLTSAVNQAITTSKANGSRAVFCPPGTYTIDQPIAADNNIRLFGAGDTTVFKLTSLLQDYVINGFACSNLIISDILFDMGGFVPQDTAYPQSFGSGVILLGAPPSYASCADCAVNRVTVINPGLYCIVTRGNTARFTSDGCKFYNSNYTPFNRLAYMLRAAGEGGPNAFCRITNVYSEGLCAYDGSSFRGYFDSWQCRFSPFGAGFAGDGDDVYNWNTQNRISNISCEQSVTSANGPNAGFEWWGTNSVLTNIVAAGNAGCGLSINRSGNVLNGAIVRDNCTNAPSTSGIMLFYPTHQSGATVTLNGVRSENNGGTGNFTNLNSSAVVIKSGCNF